MNCPRSSVDRAVASGAMRAGSTPAGGTKNMREFNWKQTIILISTIS